MASEPSTVIEISDISPKPTTQEAPDDSQHAVSPAAKVSGAPDGDDPSHMFASAALTKRAACPPVTLVFKNLDLKIDVKDPLNKNGVITKHILNNINGSVGPGELVGVLGASGAGKTSLLEVLSGRQSLYTGTYTANGKPVDATLLKSSSAYVQQDDLTLANLTVREHLLFASKLRLPNAMSDKAKEERVDEVIEKLGLKRVADTVIGHPAVHLGSRGISGGERKRLSFASEIITQPSVLLVDEPTSGLDSAMAEITVRALRDLAGSGRSIIATIHQPSSEIYALFTKIVFLAHGRVAYYGPRAGILPYFTNLGRECPYYVNPADFYIKILADLPGVEDGAKIPRELADSWDRYVSENKLMEGEPRATDSETFSSENWRFFAQYTEPDARAGTESKADPEGDEESGSTHSDLIGTKLVLEERLGRVPGATAAIAGYRPGEHEKISLNEGYANNSWVEFVLLTKRGMINTIRDPIATKARVMQTLVLGLLLGLVFLQLEDTQRGVQDKNGALYFIIVNQSMMGTFSVLQTFPLERPVIYKEHEAGMYRIGSYFLSKMVGDLPTQILFPAIFVAFTYWMIDIRNDIEVFFAIMGLVLLAANTAMSLGYLVSAATKSVTAALAIGPVSILPLMLFGGFFLNTDSIPVYFVWIEWLSPFKYAFLAAGYLMWKDVDSIECDAPVAADCQFDNGQQIIDFFQFESSVGVYVLALFALVIGFRLIAYLALKWRAAQFVAR